jgi:hypothetical protein
MSAARAADTAAALEFLRAESAQSQNAFELANTLDQVESMLVREGELVDSSSGSSGEDVDGLLEAFGEQIEALNTNTGTENTVGTSGTGENFLGTKRGPTVASSASCLEVLKGALVALIAVTCFL